MNLKRLIKNPWRIFSVLANRFPLRWVSDKAYVKLQFRAQLGYWPNLKDPKTYNEKLQWLKLYDRRPEYAAMADKAAVKAFVAERIGEAYVIPTLGVWDRFEDIAFDALPEKFVLKCTHDSGGIVICRDKATFDKVAACQKLKKSLGRSYYWYGREWPYKNIKPRIIAEPYVEDSKTRDLPDYKFFCFDGKAKAMFVATDRQSAQETKFDFFDMDYRHLPLHNGHPNADRPPEKPAAFETMRCLAEQLSQGIPHVRVDFYQADGKIYFGELTFFHWSGFVPFEPAQWDETFGSWISLPEKTSK